MRRLNVIVHRSGDLPPLDQETVEDLPVTSPTRTLIDISGLTSPEALTAALDGALRDGLTSEDLVHRRIAALRSKGHYGVPRLLDVLDGREVTARRAQLVEEAGLPSVSSPRPDSRVPSAKPCSPGPTTTSSESTAGSPGTPIVVAELLGYRFHRTKQQMSRDAERLNALVLDGFTPFQFTYNQVVARPGPRARHGRSRPPARVRVNVSRGGAGRSSGRGSGTSRRRP